jgi:Flp pilus assembly protein TadD
MPTATRPSGQGRWIPRSSFRKNVKDYPSSWNVFDSLGEAYAKKGDTRRAAEQYTKARELTKDPAQHRRIAGILAGLR